MDSHFNNLTPAEAERVAMLLEEAGEIVQACGKILRHGFESYHPDDPRTTNRMLLSREIGDILAVIDLMDGDLDATVCDFDAAIDRKLRYTHHQMERSDG